MIGARPVATLMMIGMACASIGRQPPPSLWGALSPGEYAVGYRDVGEWYPADPAGEGLRFRDYVGELDKVEALLQKQHVSDEAMVELFDATMYARRNAQPLPDPFPVVFIVKREGQTAADLAVVAEYLASHGYVVRVVDRNAKQDAKALWLHDVPVSALTMASADKSSLESTAQTLLRYLDSRR